MTLNRRDFLRASSAIAAALSIRGKPLWATTEDTSGLPSVIWLQAQGCSGCSVSLMNSLDVETLLTQMINLEFHPTLMAAAGTLAAEHALSVSVEGGYVLVVEGAIPTGAYEQCCYALPDLTALEAVRLFATQAICTVAVGSCAAFGGVVAGYPNLTAAISVSDCLGDDTVINVPGCPAHPDWMVGTIAHLLNGEIPELDAHGRPREYFGGLVHEACPNRGRGERCLKPLGCNGQKTRADCPIRQWNAGITGEGTNWCIGAGSPCHGCTEPDFPDGKSPFYKIPRPVKSK